MRLMIPHLNINGTSKGALIDEGLTALEKIQDARQAFRNITVHGRDFPTGSDFGNAVLARQAVDKAINDLELVLTAYLEGLDKSPGG